MRLEAVSHTSNSNSNSLSTSILTLTDPPDTTTRRKKTLYSNKEWMRPRRQTDPLLTFQPPVQGVLPSPHADRRCSVDSSASRLNLNTPKSSPNLPVCTSNSCPINPGNLSDPALAGFSPRKIRALKSSSSSTTSAQAASTPGIPALQLQTTRDLEEKSSPSSANNTPTVSFSNPPTAPSSTTSLSFKSQPSFEPKASHQKRSPASRSSCGIETSTGPPPALSTQRSLSQDKSRHATTTAIPLNRPRSFGATPKSEPKLQLSRPSSSLDVVLNSDSPAVAASERRQQRSSLPIGSTTTATRERSNMALSGARLSGSFLGSSSRERSNQMMDRENADTSSKESLADDSRSKNEDLFLNIAKANSTRRNSLKTERKRFGLSGLSSRASRANEEETPSPKSSRFDPDQVTPLQSQENSPSLAHGSSTVRSPTTSHHPLDENSRLRYFGVSTRTSIGLPRSRLSRTNRETSPETPPNYTVERRGSGSQEQLQGQSRTYRHSNLSTMRTTHDASAADAGERARLDAEKRLDGTESTLSTTAPSTVWDELDDLKSRIRKLELTGKLPPSSAEAMSSISGERPRTATTTVTTLSSSPKHGRKPSVSPRLEPESEQIHPLLHTALAKAKPLLSADVYRTLEATATDALKLATILNSNSPQHGSGASVVNGNGTAGILDRQVRRKADSLCRGLTELCLALSDEQRGSSSKNRPGSRDASSHYQVDGAMERESITPTVPYRRSVSHEPEDVRGQTPTVRLASGSRLETRRASILSLNSGTTIRNSQDNTNSASTPAPSRLSRASTSLRSRRLQGEDDYDDKASPASRPLSRAMTEVNAGATRYSPRDQRRSREYTSKHPLPEQHVLQQLSPQQQIGHSRLNSQSQSGIPLRRNYASPSSNLPATTHTNIQPGFRRYGASSLNTATNSAENSVNEYGSDVPGSATKYTGSGLLHLRPRTNSTGIRRIGIRQRQYPSTTDGENAGDELD
ncbi:hypothetical protein AJ79_01176 [Helicocarpus griseus UAMH5409]|uniref:LPXTG-motif cell wall anchor domain protein n=1 Tax=Helicocarpus griseus UAMH5409 TaxID=1447875 RepID=A0A2B7Y8D1_9EURO|nr:hypothetical protein AJ79_01176 [Helicocarpus griseus UAMH5409]